MNTVEIIKKYFWPYPPKDITESGNEHFKKSLKKASLWGIPDFTDNRNVWDRHADNSVREKNQNWLKTHAVTFAKRWSVLSISSWLIAWVASGILLIEVPFAHLGFISGVIAVVFFYVHRTLNKKTTN